MMRIIISIGLILLGGALVVMQLGVRRRCTEEATATVAGIERKTHRSRGRTSAEYHPVLEFAAGNATVHKAAEISSMFRGKYKEGDTLTVRYNPEKPEEFLVKGKFLWTGIFGGALLMLLGAAGLILNFIK